jgi:hypothetical protein
MKKLLLFLIIASLAKVSGAQIQFGLKGGINFANISQQGAPPTADKFKSITDFNAGLMASIPLCSHFSLQPEVVYSGQGGNLDERVLRLNYLNIPVLLKYLHPSGLFAETGPQIGFMLSGKELFDGKSYDDSENKVPELSWAFGMGYQLPKINLGIDARYNLGLTEIYKRHETPETSKNNVFQLGLFYVFPKI